MMGNKSNIFFSVNRGINRKKTGNFWNNMLRAVMQFFRPFLFDTSIIQKRIIRFIYFNEKIYHFDNKST